MRVLKSELKKIIKEEFEDVMNEKKRQKVKVKRKPCKRKKDLDYPIKEDPDSGKWWERMADVGSKETDRERKEKVFPGYEDQKRLSLGIVEEDSEYHGSDGRFSSEAASTCDSLYFKTGKRKRKSGSLGKKKPTSGRGRKKSGHGKWKCKDGSRVTEAVDTPHDESVMTPHDLYDAAKELQRNQVLIRKLKQSVKTAKTAGMKNCPLSWKQTAEIINQLELSSKGKLHPAEK